MGFKVGDKVQYTAAWCPRWPELKDSIGTITANPLDKFYDVDFGLRIGIKQSVKDCNLTIISNKEETMNTSDKLFNSKLTEDEKTLREAGIKSSEGRITPDGVTAMMDFLYEKHGKEIAAAVRELKKCDCKEK